MQQDIEEPAEVLLCIKDQVNYMFSWAKPEIMSCVTTNPQNIYQSTITKGVKMIKIIEVIEYGDFDMPYTHSVWYKELTGEEAKLNTRGFYEREMVKDFKNLTGFEMTANHWDKMGIHECFEKELFSYLKARGYKKVKTTKITLHD